LRILIVTMYYPPAAGAGVQRPLALAGHLPSLGVETHVLTPDDAKWVHRDDETPAPPSVHVHRVRNRAPRTHLRGRELGESRGGRRLLAELRLLPRRALVPDPEVLWALAAIPAAARIVRDHRIDVVLTTSPPVSLHLVGAAARRLTRARWIADLRDPLIASAYRHAEYRTERSVARLVARHADAVVTASDGIADELRTLGRAEAVTVVLNGCDPKDFDGLVYRRSDQFRITHTGSFLSRRDPRPFLRALRETSAATVARFVGDFRPADLAYAREIGVAQRVTTIPFVPRREALALQRDSEALLLLVPESGRRGHAVVTAKLSEYLAARRPILAAVPLGGEAARVLAATCAATIVAPDDVAGMVRALRSFERRWRHGTLDVPPLAGDLQSTLSGRALAEKIAAVSRSLS
jgi:hypothetical protein